MSATACLVVAADFWAALASPSDKAGHGNSALASSSAASTTANFGPWFADNSFGDLFSALEATVGVFDVVDTGGDVSVANAMSENFGLPTLAQDAESGVEW